MHNLFYISLSGTRYLRRGVDDHGYVANYVETELVSSWTFISTPSFSPPPPPPPHHHHHHSPPPPPPPPPPPVFSSAGVTSS